MKLGQKPKVTGERDAVHVAIVSVICDHIVRAGDPVGYVDGKATLQGEPVGIVDPFRQGIVASHEPFWLVLYPETVTGMVHHWSHPAFETGSDEARSDDSEAWLRAYAEEMNSDDEPDAAFCRLIDGLEEEKLHVNGSELDSLHDLDDADDLKRHAEAYLGITIDWDNYTFTCSC